MDDSQYGSKTLWGGAWPFSVGGVASQVSSDNERDPNMLILFRIYS